MHRCKAVATRLRVISRACLLYNSVIGAWNRFPAAVVNDEAVDEFKDLFLGVRYERLGVFPDQDGREMEKRAIGLNICRRGIRNLSNNGSRDILKTEW